MNSSQEINISSCEDIYNYLQLDELFISDDNPKSPKFELKKLEYWQLFLIFLGFLFYQQSTGRQVHCMVTIPNRTYSTIFMAIGAMFASLKSNINDSSLSPFFKKKIGDNFYAYTIDVTKKNVNVRACDAKLVDDNSYINDKYFFKFQITDNVSSKNNYSLLIAKDYGLRDQKMSLARPQGHCYTERIFTEQRLSSHDIKRLKIYLDFFAKAKFDITPFWFFNGKPDCLICSDSSLKEESKNLKVNTPKNKNYDLYNFFGFGDTDQFYNKIYHINPRTNFQINYAANLIVINGKNAFMSYQKLMEANPHSVLSILELNELRDPEVQQIVNDLKQYASDGNIFKEFNSILLPKGFSLFYRTN